MSAFCESDAERVAGMAAPPEKRVGADQETGARERARLRWSIAQARTLWQ